MVPVLFVTHPDYVDHAIPGHPERPERLAAVDEGLARAGLAGEVVPVAADLAEVADIERVHSADYVDALRRYCLTGGGWLDGDTGVVPRSWDAALRAAGAAHLRLRTDTDWLLDVVRFVAAQRHARTRGTTR